MLNQEKPGRKGSRLMGTLYFLLIFLKKKNQNLLKKKKKAALGWPQILGSGHQQHRCSQDRSLQRSPLWALKVGSGCTQGACRGSTPDSCLRLLLPGRGASMSPVESEPRTGWVYDSAGKRTRIREEVVGRGTAVFTVIIIDY